MEFKFKWRFLMGITMKTKNILWAVIITLSLTSSFAPAAAFGVAGDTLPTTRAMDNAPSSAPSNSAEGGGGGGGGSESSSSACVSEEKEISVFRLGPENIDSAFIAWCMMGFIVFTLIFEFLLQKLEHSIKDHTHYVRVLHKLFKEFTILGFVSFVLGLTTELASVPIDKRVLLDIVHLWIFFTALFFVLHALVLLKTTSIMKNAWDHISVLTREQLMHNLNVASTSLYARFPRFRWFFPRPRVVDEVEFHVAKQLFIKTYGLDPNFDFSKYLRKSVTNSIVEHLNVSWRVWIVLTVLVFIFSMYAKFSNTASNPQDSLRASLYGTVAVSWCIFVSAIVLYILALRCRKRLRHLCKVFRFEELNAAIQTAFPQHSRQMNVRHLVRHFSSTTLMRQGAIATSQEDLRERSKEYSPIMFPQLFFWRKPQVLDKLLDLLFLSQCFFFALTVFTSQQAFHLFSDEHAILYVCGTIGPQALTMLLVKPAIFCNLNFVGSFARVHKRTLQGVLDGMKKTFLLKKELVQKINCYDQSSLRDLFNQVDKNGDGVLCPREFKRWLKSLHVHVNDSQASRLIRSIDADLSGGINFEEFSSMANFFNNTDNKEHGCNQLERIREVQENDNGERNKNEGMLVKTNPNDDHDALQFITVVSHEQMAASAAAATMAHNHVEIRAAASDNANQHHALKPSDSHHDFLSPADARIIAAASHAHSHSSRHDDDNEEGGQIQRHSQSHNNPDDNLPDNRPALRDVISVSTANAGPGESRSMTSHHVSDVMWTIFDHG